MLSSETTKSKTNIFGPFSLGNRDIIFQKQKESGSIIPHIAFEQQQKFSLEQIFQSLHLLLLDTVSSELKFERVFFGTYNFFSPLFSKVIDMCLVSISAHSRSQSFTIYPFFSSDRIPLIQKYERSG
jgi:hypothetical protein